MKSAIIIPCYKVKKHIKSVLKKFINKADFLIFIDDDCPENSLLEIKNKDKKIIKLKNSKNIGVGGSTLKGFKYAFLNLKVDFAVKVDGDDQMDPNDFQKFKKNFKEKEKALYLKGTRLINRNAYSNFPRKRLLGNIFLSILCKLTLGSKDISDPTCGYIGMNQNLFKKVLKSIDNVGKRYSFETSLILNLFSEKNCEIKQVPVNAIYKDEISNLKEFSTGFSLLVLMWKTFKKRVVTEYFIEDFSVGSIFLALSILLAIFTFTLFISFIIYGIFTGKYVSIYYMTIVFFFGITLVNSILFFIFYDNTRK